MYRILWIKFSHITILSVNNATSLNSDLFQECSEFAPTTQVLKHLTPWFHSSLLLLPEQLDTRVPFRVQLIPPSFTSLSCWVTAQTAGPCGHLSSSLLHPKLLLLLCLRTQSPNSFLLPEPLIIWGEGRQRIKILHSHFWKSYGSFQL